MYFDRTPHNKNLALESEINAGVHRKNWASPTFTTLIVSLVFLTWKFPWMLIT